MRTHYLNGDEIGLQHTGCDGCSPSMIQGVLCHETGCPYAWKDDEESIAAWLEELDAQHKREEHEEQRAREAFHW